MVKIDEEFVYECLTPNWQSTADIYGRIVDEMGDVKTWKEKLNYFLVNFEMPYVSVVKLCRCLENLTEEGFAAKRVVTIKLDGEERLKAEYKINGRVIRIKNFSRNFGKSFSAA